MSQSIDAVDEDGTEDAFQGQDLMDYDMVDFEASHDHDIKQMLKISISQPMTHKLAYTIFSANVGLTTFILGHFPENFYIFHSLKTIILLSYRWYSYKIIKNHYYMFDFCYYTNGLLMFYLWSPWQLGFLFPILFALSNGPLLWAIVLWRNSLVPHSIDKMTSLLLHVSPAFTTWSIRWYSKTDQRFPLCSQSSLHEDCTNDVGLNELILFPLLCSLVWVALYSIIVFIWRGERVKQRKYVNSYTYLVENAKKQYLVKICLIFGPKYQRVMYMFWHMVYIMVSILIAYYAFFSLTFHFALIVALLVCACYNGGSFYVNVFGRLYYKGNEGESDVKQE